MKASSHTSRSRLRLSLVWASVATLVLGLSGGQSSAADQAPVIKSIRSLQPEKIGMSNKDMERICAAAISILDSRPTSTIMVDGIEQGGIRLSYRGPGSPARRYACSLAGENVLLARQDEASPKEAIDGRITFRLTAADIHITVAYSDGSEKHGTFPR